MQEPDHDYPPEQSLSTPEQIEAFCQMFGEQWRRMITSSLLWLDEEEPKWNVDRPTDRKRFLEGLIQNAVPKP